MDSSSDALKLNQIISYLQNLESRVSRLEDQLNIQGLPSKDEDKLTPIIQTNISNRADSLEDEIGQYWFAKVGIVVLSIGIIFLLAFPHQSLPPVLPSLAGYVIVGILFWLAKYLRTSFQFLSQYLFGSALLLLYFATMRLHFWCIDPPIKDAAIITTLLAVVTVIHLYVSYKKESVYLNSIGITLACITTLISNNPYSIFFILIFLSLLIVHLQIKYEWNGFFIYGISLVFLTELFWFLNNPFMGNELVLTGQSYFSLAALLILAVIFSMGNYFRTKNETENWSVIVSTIVNCFWFYTLFLVISILKYKEALGILNLSTSLIFLVLSAMFWTKEKSKYSTFFYSILAYSALSVAIIAQFPQPDFFVWLCWQSLIVVTTALWFRSKIIIVANFAMYLIIFFSYLILTDKIGTTTLSFGLVALITARIMNWQKDRLDLKTENMRTAYLASAFFIFPYALYHIFPKDYVGISWTVVAIIYYVLSAVLKNKKYRWMALLTFLITVLYMLFIGTTNLEPTYRIISFLVLGLVLLAISIIYGKVKSKNVSTS